MPSLAWHTRMRWPALDDFRNIQSTHLYLRKVVLYMFQKSLGAGHYVLVCHARLCMNSKGGHSRVHGMLSFSSTPLQSQSTSHLLQASMGCQRGTHITTCQHPHSPAGATVALQTLALQMPHTAPHNTVSSQKFQCNPCMQWCYLNLTLDLSFT